MAKNALVMSNVKSTSLLLTISFLLSSFCINYLQAQCSPPTLNTSYEHIANVTLGSISNPSGADPNGYGDYTTESTDLTAGSQYTITLTPHGDEEEGWAVWIDYDDNGVLNDPGETVVSIPKTAGVVSGTFTVPSGTSTGNKTMRIYMHYKCTPTDPCNKCTTNSWGEIEDYTVNVVTGGSDTEPPTAPGGC